MNGYPDTLIAADNLRLADQFFQAFLDLPKRIPPLSWPRYFMLCHATELALKAFLLYRGKTPKELRNLKVRHSIKELITEATKAGLVLDVTVKNNVLLLSEAHEQFWHRYPQEDAKPVYTIDQFEPDARELLKNVSAAIFSTGTP